MRGGNPSVVVNSRPARAGLINRKKKKDKGYANPFFQFPNNTKKEGNPKKYRVVILN